MLYVPIIGQLVEGGYEIKRSTMAFMTVVIDFVICLIFVIYINVVGCQIQSKKSSVLTDFAVEISNLPTSFEYGTEDDLRA